MTFYNDYSRNPVTCAQRDNSEGRTLSADHIREMIAHNTQWRMNTNNNIGAAQWWLSYWIELLRLKEGDE